LSPVVIESSSRPIAGATAAKLRSALSTRQLGQWQNRRQRALPA
jgi:hypothetical protein